MKKKSFLAGLLTVLLLAALGYVVYRYRDRIAELLHTLKNRIRGLRCHCSEEYDDFADV